MLFAPPPSTKDDAAVYLCSVIQNMIERLFAGALASCGKPDLRTKYGGTGKDVQPGADVQPRHLQVMPCALEVPKICCLSCIDAEER